MSLQQACHYKKLGYHSGYGSQTRSSYFFFRSSPSQMYGMMYVIGFIISGYLLRKLVDEGFFHVAKEKIDSYITHLIIGLFLGADSFMSLCTTGIIIHKI